MGVQVTLRTMLGQFLSAAGFNANNSDIEAALNKTLDRTDAVNNSMEVDLDLGLNKIINLASDPVNDTDAVNKKYVDAQTTDAQQSANDAAQSALEAQQSADDAAASAGAAGLSETNAAQSVVDAQLAADASQLSANASQASAVTSQLSADASDASAIAAQATLDSFNGIYYGPLSVDPVLDPNGDPVDEGDIYWNTVLNETRIYNGATWEPLGSGGSGTTTQDRQVYTNVAGQTVFAIEYDTGLLSVNVNGVLLDPSQYTAITGVSVTLLDPVVSDSDVIDLVGFTSLGFVSDTAVYVTTEFRNVQGQSSFPVTYVLGQEVVHLNGVKLSSESYTASDQVSIVLAEPIQSDSDELDVRVYQIASLTSPEATRDLLDVYSTEESDAGNKNYLINGGMDIWQRGTVFNSTAQYTADRWFDVLGADVVERSATVNGFRLKLTASSAANSRIVQRVEGADLRGRTVTLSALINSETGTANARIINSAGTVSQVYHLNTPAGVSTEVSVTFTIPTDGDGEYTEIRLYSGGIGITYFSKVQLISGSIAKPFIYTPTGETLALCQRYYQLSYLGGQVIDDGSLGQGFINYSPVVEMRTTPHTITNIDTQGVINGGFGTIYNPRIIGAPAGSYARGTDGTVNTFRGNYVDALDAEL